MYKWLEKYIEPHIKLFSILPLISAFAFNIFVYSGSQILTNDWHHYDLTTPFDLNVPTIPWFMYIYFGCYLFWILNYIMVGHLGKEKLFRFVTADLCSRLICGLFFLLLPTTNIALRPEFAQLPDSFSRDLLQFLYNIDKPTNLFPSIHCLVSWFCYIGIRGDKRIPAWYRGFSCVFALAVCVSTQVTKQHYIVDVFAGIGLAELMFFISNHCSLYKYVERFFTGINARVKRWLTKENQFAKQEENSI